MKLALKTLVVPALFAAFFAGALLAYQASLRNLNAEAKPDQAAAIRQLDFISPCLGLGDDPELTRSLEEAGICLRIRGQAGAAGTMGAIVLAVLGYLLYLQVLAARARRSRAALAQGYRWGARLAVGLGLMKSVLEPLAAAYALFELTVLAMNAWFPKLVLAIGAVGLYAAYHGAKAIVARLTLEGNEPFATELTRAQAPRLWAALDKMASWVKTEPPNHVLVGETPNCYVTELPVVYPKGRTTGRTLHLSRPLLQGWSRDEALAVVGHELAHFAGEDALLSRQVSPYRARLFHVARGLEAGASAFFAAPLFNFFLQTFELVDREYSRARELAADATGAAMTSQEAAASALVRAQVLGEAFEIKAAALAGATLRPLGETPAPSFTQADSEALVVNQYLRHVAGFWESLFDLSQAHPWDTHPPLRARLEALGVRWDSETVRRWFEKERDDRTAYAEWLGETEPLLQEAREAHLNALDQVARRDELQEKVSRADVAAPEGRALLDQHFPPRTFRYSRGRYAASMVLLALAGLSALGLAATMLIAELSQVAGTGALALGGLGLLAWCARQVPRHGEGRLTLTAVGLSYTGWNQELPFANVAEVSWQNQSGTLMGTFRLVTPVRRLEKWSVVPWARKTHVLTVDAFGQGGLELAQLIERYRGRSL